MKTLPLVLVVVLAALASGLTTAVVSSRTVDARLAREEPAARPAEPEPTGEFAGALQELSRQQAELAEAVAELRMQVRSAREAAERTAVRGEVAVVDERPEPVDTAAQPGTAAGEGASAAEGPMTVESAWAELQTPGLTDSQQQAIWKRVREAGLLEEVIAEYEERAEREPANPERQYELGGAYLQKIFEVGNGPEAGLWATKADKAFDAALELDPAHWEARFSKAVSLSFWPPIMGKQGQAIQQFEKLAAQQAQMPTDPKFAQTHLLLGNMYQQAGKLDKAIASWEAGLAQFPGNASLKQQLETYKGGQ